MAEQIKPHIPARRPSANELHGPPHPPNPSECTLSQLFAIWLELLEWLNFQRTLLVAPAGRQLVHLRYQPQWEQYATRSLQWFMRDHQWLVNLREKWDNNVQLLERNWFEPAVMADRVEFISHACREFNRTWAPAEHREMDELQEIERLADVYAEEVVKCHESGQQPQLPPLRPDQAPAVMSAFVKRLQKRLSDAGFSLSPLFLFGFPGEDEEDTDTELPGEDEDEDDGEEDD